MIYVKGTNVTSQVFKTEWNIKDKYVYVVYEIHNFWHVAQPL